jgi:Protein of unknown function (DUF1592)/Protein of unknown function (DUF1588)/Protein of unknown function (DUF1587)/Protein of unknown function (DUF1585)/Protein of unknown function (DUF1595)
MHRAVYVIGGAAVLAAGAAAYLWHNESPPARLERQWAMLDRYCVDCHNDAEYTGGVSFEHSNPADVVAEAGTFEAAIRKLRVGIMPPRTEPQPDAETRYAFVTALEATLDRAAEAEPYAGSQPVHRLNRAEYANAIRDLLGVEIDVEELLPSDGGDYGFDNIAAVLTTSPLLLERYLTVAQRVSALAVGDPDAVPTAATYKIGVEVTQDQHMEGLPLGTRGGTLVDHTFPADASYVLSGRLLRTVAEGYVGVEGHEKPFEFVITLDGEQVYSAPVGGPEDHELSSKDILGSRVAVDERMTSPPIPITAGAHEVGFTWIERPATEQNVWQPALRSTQEAHNPAGLPRLETAVIAGPYDVTGVGDTPSRERIFVCRPETAAEEPACAETIFANLTRRAFRRPVGADDIEAPLSFYTQARENGADFDAGVRAGLTRILVSPSFLFRVERDPVDRPDGAVHAVTDVELASRLSFFLWSSIPDDELLGLAEAGRLHEPSVLEAQVRRMVADARSEALVENFTGQWLQLRNLEQRVVPDLLLFPDFDDNLRQAFRRETELLFAHVLRENLSVLDLLDADYTFVNERLARHYGIEGVYGSRFRRVELDDPNRWGLLGHGSVLSLTSAASRTSPIIRGKYIMANLLDNPPPMPPAVVPALEESKPKDRPSTVREQLELHRANPTCAACHNNLDPLGFALENFNAVGQWQDETRDGLPIDSAGILADGTPVDGPIALREALLSRPEVFAGTVTEKFLIYALGRGLEPADMPQVRKILRNTAEDDYRLMSIILGVVDSLPFQMRTKAAPDVIEADVVEPDAGQTIALRGE